MSLKDLIDASGKTRYQIAKESGMSQGTLRRYYDGESSLSNMTIGTAIKLSRALDYSLPDFIEKGLDGSDEIESLFERACRLGRRWQKGDINRVYFKPENFGLENCKIGDTELSKNQTRLVEQSKFYLDADSEHVRCKPFGKVWEVYTSEVVKRIEDALGIGMESTNEISDGSKV